MILNGLIQSSRDVFARDLASVGLLLQAINLPW